MLAGLGVVAIVLVVVAILTADYFIDADSLINASWG